MAKSSVRDQAKHRDAAVKGVVVFDGLSNGICALTRGRNNLPAAEAADDRCWLDSLGAIGTGDAAVFGSKEQKES